MATIDLSLLTALNPKEKESFSAFVMETIKSLPQMGLLNTLYTGVQMKEQIVFASQFGKTGIKDAGTSRPNTGAGTILTEKFWEPQPTGDTISLQQATVNGLFKAYYTKIAKYTDLYDMQGTEEFKFLGVLLAESAMQSLARITWLADKTVGAAGAGAAGLIDNATNQKFYNVIDGFWKQIFNEVLANKVKRYKVAENEEATTALQLNLADYRAEAIFEGVWDNADSRLRFADGKYLAVSGKIFQNYRQGLQKKGIYTDLNLLMNGIPALMWNGVPVINMENVWDNYSFADFVDNTTNNAYYLPNRVILSTPDNMPIGTLNEGDITSIDSYYEWVSRTGYLAYGYTIDAKLFEGYMASVAY